MSREVEVQNIQMSASVPEDLQISLGHLIQVGDTTLVHGTTQEAVNRDVAANRSHVGLSGNQGILDYVSNNADNGGVATPWTGDDAASMLDWSNTVDISAYYRMGKIIPASSIDGKDIFFTPDASGVGKTLKSGANFYQVANVGASPMAATPDPFQWNSSTKTYDANGTGDYARTTLHAIRFVDEADDYFNDGDRTHEILDKNTAANFTAKGNSYRPAYEWNVTNDDGYYVDIPIFIRSSSNVDTPLSVDAYVTANAAKHADNDDLYLAARAVILYNTTAESTTTTNSSNLLRIRQDEYASTTSIIDYMYTTNREMKDAVKTVADYKATYDNCVEYDGTTFLTIPAKTASETGRYGTAVKAVVRVWLEGEDPNCWNENAGQDFNINLKFVKGTIGSTTETENANGVAFPAAWANSRAYDKTADLSADLSGLTDMVAKVTFEAGTTDTDLEFTFNGNDWILTKGTPRFLNGYVYHYGTATGTVVEDVDDIATQLKSALNTVALVEATGTTAIKIERTEATPAGGNGGN
jgi:hypothetical protein